MGITNILPFLASVGGKAHMKMSQKRKRVRYSAGEAENMIMNEHDSGDSDIDLGEDLSDNGWGTCSDLDAETEEETAVQEEMMSDNRAGATTTTSSG